MLVWYAALAAAGVWAVFDSPAIDYRVVALGAVLPVAEVALGHPGPLHSLVVAVAVLAAVMVLTRGRRLVRRRWLGIPIGLLAHLVLSGVWADTDAFWWPLTGTAFSGAEPPVLARGAWSVVLEGVGVAVAVWWYGRVGLDDPAARSRFVRSGQLPRATGTRSRPPLSGSC